VRSEGKSMRRKKKYRSVLRVVACLGRGPYGVRVNNLGKVCFKKIK
jgi:hypothetical protein